MKGEIAEIFKSIQGEGIYVGIPQVFIRFYGCSFGCSFCDTRLNSYEEMSPLELLKKVNSLNKGINCLSITGGEPLEQIDFLREFLILAKKENFKIHLETNGIFYNELNSIIDSVDIIAMDIKLPSSTGKEPFWEKHEKFLDIAEAKDLLVKIVICLSTIQEDLFKAMDLLTKRKKIPLVLQPNTFELSEKLWDKIFQFQNIALKYLSDVRIIPQVHKLVRIR